MARTQKYTEELLLEAVVKYAETERGKIKATELADWAGANITGLEGVRDYHFMRPAREKNPQTGAVIVRQKSCTVRMEEINKARSLTAQISRNALLKASTIEEFMNQPGFIQRRQIAETRETVDCLHRGMKTCPARTKHCGRKTKGFMRSWKRLRKPRDGCRTHRGVL